MYWAEAVFTTITIMMRHFYSVLTWTCQIGDKHHVLIGYLVLQLDG